MIDLELSSLCSRHRFSERPLPFCLHSIGSTSKKLEPSSFDIKHSSTVVCRTNARSGDGLAWPTHVHCVGHPERSEIGDPPVRDPRPTSSCSRSAAEMCRAKSSPDSANVRMSGDPVYLTSVLSCHPSPHQCPYICVYLIESRTNSQRLRSLTYPAQNRAKDKPLHQIFRGVVGTSAMKPVHPSKCPWQRYQTAWFVSGTICQRTA